MHTLKFLALSVLTLSVGLAADHPIIISNGSPLYIEHDSWSPTGDHDRDSNVHDSVTRVVIASKADPDPKKPTIIPFNHEKLTLALRYGTVKLTVTANHHGGQDVNVHINKSFSKDFQKQGNKYVRDETSTHAAITTVKIQQGATSLPPVTVLEPTVITICYGTPDGSVEACK